MILKSENDLLLLQVILGFGEPSTLPHDNSIFESEYTVRF